MATLFHSALRVRQFLVDFLPQPPSPDLMKMVGDLCAGGRPLMFKLFDDSPHGETEINPDAIHIGLGAAPPSEGLVAHEMAHALLEMRGWPRFFGTEAGDHWLARVQMMLINLLDHGAGLALQLQYGIDARGQEEILLAQTEEQIQRLLMKADLLPKVGLSGAQIVEFGTGLALTCLDYFWRTGDVPDHFHAAMDLIDGSRDLFAILADCAPQGIPTEGWPARRLMGQLIERIDDFLEEEGGIRPLALLGHVVPATYANDTHRPLDQVASILSKPLAQHGDHLVTIINNRDGLPFGFRYVANPHMPFEMFLDRLGQQPFGSVARHYVPPEYLIWQPTGSPL
jgi:hypothetical protein